jgi:KDO2-lipid IV(A) lauroyltransferase
MSDAPSASRCGIDTVEIDRIERLLRETPVEDLARLFSQEELDECRGAGHAASLAARFAGKEACLKLFPRETALGSIGPADFTIVRGPYGATRVTCSPAAQAVLARNRVRDISVSLTHGHASASAVALAHPIVARPGWTGRLLYRFLPFRRRIVLENLRRVFGAAVPDTEIELLAQEHYAHLASLLWEFLRFPWLSSARRRALVRVENLEALTAALAHGRGVLILSGHFGNFEVATAGGLDAYPEARGRFWFVRKPLKPAWLDWLVSRRFRRAGFGILPRRGGLDAILDKLAAGDLVVFPFDQHARFKEGMLVDFFGQPASTRRSLAVIALSTGAPVVPAATWRDSSGSHVLRFELALAPVEHADANEAIRLNSRAYNAALEQMVLRHPEQWWWTHRRWKPWRQRARPARMHSTGETGGK